MTLTEAIERVSLILNEAMAKDSRAAGYILIGVINNDDGVSCDAAITFELPDDLPGHIMVMKVVERAVELIRADTPKEPPSSN